MATAQWVGSQSGSNLPAPGAGGSTSTRSDRSAIKNLIAPRAVTLPTACEDGGTKGCMQRGSSNAIASASLPVSARSSTNLTSSPRSHDLSSSDTRCVVVVVPVVVVVVVAVVSFIVVVALAPVVDEVEAAFTPRSAAHADATHASTTVHKTIPRTLANADPLTSISMSR